MEIRVAETVLAFALVVLLSVRLRKWEIIRTEDGPLFARLLTQAVLPAVILSQLAAHPLERRQVLLVIAMIVAGSASLVVAWAAGVAMRLDRPKIGALMITSAFGSSALLGYPMIQFAFPNDPRAMADAVIVSELGVGLPIFTLCPIIAMHFGTGPRYTSTIWKSIGGYFRSPIFVAVVAGVVVSQIPFPAEHPLFFPIFEAFHMIEGALTILSCLVLGLQLSFKSTKGILPLVVVSAAIQMGLQPFLASAQATLYRLSAEQHQVLVLISSLPSAVLGPVFATRFQCDSETASSLVFINIALSAIVVPLAFAVLTR